MKPCELNVSELEFSDLKTLNNGGKMVFVNYKGDLINLQTPELRLPWDVNADYAEDANGKYNFTVSLDGYDSDKNVKELYDKLMEMDNAIREYAKNHSKTFFQRKTASDELVDTNYTPIVKLSKTDGEPDGKYPPSLKLKVQKKDDKCQCKFYNSQKEKFDVDSREEGSVRITDILVKDAKCKMLIRCNGIWLINGKFGCTWKVEQLRTEVPTKKLDDYAFRDDDEEVEFVESDDDDDEDEDDDEGEINSDSDSEEEVEEVKEVKKEVKKVRKGKTAK